MVLSHFDLCKLIIIELCYLLILKINYIGMIRQKRFSISRIPQNNQNGNKEALHQGNTNDMIDKQNCCEKKEHAKENRTGLNEITSNANIFTNRDSLFLKLLGPENKYKQQSRPKGNESILIKIAELIKNQDIPVSICHSNKSKPLSCTKQRPNTSFCRESKVSLDHTHVNKFSVVLQLSKNQEVKPPERTSTSRALMNYSKVFRNNSNQGFRVKKDLNMINRFVHLSAQKIVFQEKEKKQKKQLNEKSFDRIIASRKGRNSQKAKDRYDEEEEEFSLGGWDYFE